MGCCVSCWFVCLLPLPLERAGVRAYANTNPLVKCVGTGRHVYPRQSSKPFVNSPRFVTASDDLSRHIVCWCGGIALALTPTHSQGEREPIQEITRTNTNKTPTGIRVLARAASFTCAILSNFISPLTIQETAVPGDLIHRLHLYQSCKSGFSLPARAERFLCAPSMKGARMSKACVVGRPSVLC